MIIKHPLNNRATLALIAAGGFMMKKDRVDEDKVRDSGLEVMEKDLSDAISHMKDFKAQFEEQGRQLKTMQDNATAQKEISDEDRAKIEKQAGELADTLAKLQACEAAIDTFKAEKDAPFYRGGSDLKEKDIENAIELQKRAFLNKGGELAKFKPDMDNLVDAAVLRNVSHKLLGVGLESKEKIIRSFDEIERKAFDAASLDVGFFSPEMLGIEVDCEIECNAILDLYMQVNVSRSQFMFPHVESYGDIGKYDCDAKCDAEFGPEGNITWKNGKTSDFRGVFCFQRDVLREANYDLLGFMMRAAARSHRINRNQVQITGDGVNEPLGWLTADCFTKVAAPAANPTHQDLRQFLASAPVEYGPVTPVSHQNVFAYFASMVDNNGRFLFGDGLMGFSPSNTSENWRISNCLPDPTEGLTRGSTANPMASGDFIMAAGVWEMAYASVSQRPMFMEQFEGQSSAWCVKYQFGAKDGGFIACCPAARTFQTG